MITLTGVLEKDNSGEFPARVGIGDKPITFSGTEVSDDLSSKGANTGADGKFTVTGKASDKDKVGTWEIQAHFAGDTENNASNSNPEKYTVAKPKATTYLKLDPIPEVDAKGMITLTGVLEKDNSGEFPARVGIGDKPITFSGTEVSDDLSSKGANTGADGKFTVTGKASDKDRVGTWEIQAHFAGDTENNASNSNPEKYTVAKPKATTYLKLDPIPEVDAKGMITLTGVLEKDNSGEFPARVGIGDKPITFSGTEVSDDLSSKGANTGADGKFTVTGKASDKDKVGTWEIQAHFAGDTENNASNSNPEKYTVAKPSESTTYLKLDPIPDVNVVGSIKAKGWYLLMVTRAME